MPLIGINQVQRAERAPSTFDQIAAGLQIAAKLLDTGVNAYAKVQDAAESKKRGMLYEAQAKGWQSKEDLDNRVKESTIRANDSTAAFNTVARPLTLRKDQADVIKKERDNAMPQTYPGEMAIFSTLPERDRDNAIKELKDFNSYTKSGNDSLDSFDNLNNFSRYDAAAPGFLGGNKKAYDAERAKIAAAMIGKFPGIRSDSDFRTIVAPQLPTFTDSDQEKVDKRASFAAWMQSQAPETPLLNSLKGLKSTHLVQDLRLEPRETEQIVGGTAPGAATQSQQRRIVDSKTLNDYASTHNVSVDEAKQLLHSAGFTIGK